LAAQPAEPDGKAYQSVRQAFLTLLQARKTYPLRARDKGIQGQVELSVTLDITGRAEQLDISRSSGSSLLDNAALDLVKTSLPFRHDLGTRFSTDITIAYRLTD
jgi:protein TonB